MTPPRKHRNRTPSHRITSADKSRGRASGGIKRWGTGKRKLLACCLLPPSAWSRSSGGSCYSHLACRLRTSCSPSSLPPGCFKESISVPWPYQPGRSAGRALGIMDSCEGSHYISRSGIVRANPAAVVDGKYEPAGEELPDGWLKECRRRKKQHGSRMGDMFYIDPIHGYEFRSLKAAYRYLQSGDISQCVNRRKIKDLLSAGDLSHHTGRPSDDTANELNQYNAKSLGDAQLSPKHGSSKPDNINPIQRESEIQSGSKEHSPGETESVTRKGVTVEQRTKEKKHKAKPIKQIAAPLRSSPRLAAVRMSQEADNASRDERTSTQTDRVNQLRPKQVENPTRKVDSSVVPEKDYGTLSSSEKTEDNYCLVPNQIQASVPSSSADVVCQDALAGVPVLPQQVELGGTTAGMPGSALSSLFQHVWSDPCLQFAFRTLTGDIPVLNDNLAAANCFLPQQNLKPCTRNHAQVDHASLSMPRPTDKLCGSSRFPPQ